MPQYPPLSSGISVFNVKDFGALGNGTGDDTGPINAARLLAEAVGGIVFCPPGTYITYSPIVIGATCTFLGAGVGATQIRAGSTWSGSTGVLAITTPLKHCVFQDLTLDGGNQAPHALYYSSTETSNGHRALRVVGQNCTSHCFYNVGNEDCTYTDCHTQGDEGLPLTVKPAFYCSVPAGQVRLVGCEFFGLCDLNFEQFVAYASVLGPVWIDDSSSSHARYANAGFYGCYFYDGGTGTARSCLSGTQMCQITCDCCTFIAGNQPQFIGGSSNMSNTFLTIQNSEFITGVANSQATMSLVDNISGTGRVELDNIAFDPASSTAQNVFGTGVSASIAQGVKRQPIYFKSGQIFKLQDITEVPEFVMAAL